MYSTTTESRPCACGGKIRSNATFTKRHHETTKHRTWRFQALCCEFIEIDIPLKVKIQMLKEMKTLVQYIKD